MKTTLRHTRSGTLLILVAPWPADTRSFTLRPGQEHRFAPLPVAPAPSPDRLLLARQALMPELLRLYPVAPSSILKARRVTSLRQRHARAALVWALREMEPTPTHAEISAVLGGRHPDTIRAILMEAARFRQSLSSFRASTDLLVRLLPPA